MMMKLDLLRLEETGVDEGRFYIFRVVIRACFGGVSQIRQGITRGVIVCRHRWL